MYHSVVSRTSENASILHVPSDLILVLQIVWKSIGKRSIAYLHLDDDIVYMDFYSVITLLHDLLASLRVQLHRLRNEFNPVPNGRERFVSTQDA